MTEVKDHNLEDTYEPYPIGPEEEWKSTYNSIDVDSNSVSGTIRNGT